MAKTAADLPLELRYKILEMLGTDFFAHITKDHKRTSYLLLKEGRYQKYFRTRPFNYVVEEDEMLINFMKGVNVSRLPLLSYGWYQCYAESLPGKDLSQDPLLAKFFFPADIKRVPLLFQGKYKEYENCMKKNDKLFYKYLCVGNPFREYAVGEIRFCMNTLVCVYSELEHIKNNPTDVGRRLVSVYKRLRNFGIRYYQCPDALLTNAICGWMRRNIGMLVERYFVICPHCFVTCALECHAYHCPIRERRL